MEGEADEERPAAKRDSASVSSDAVIGRNVVIGPFAVIGRLGAEPVHVGDDTVIDDHVLIEPGSRIGAGCVIEAHCRIGAGSVIAAGSHVRSGIPFSDGSTRRAGAPTWRPTDDSDAVSEHALVASNARLGGDVQIGPYAIVGWDGEEPAVVGDRTTISPFALIEPGAVIGEGCTIDAYCRIAAGARVGDGTQVLYGAAVFEDALIGRDCIIGGNVADRTIIEDFVTHFGEIAHDYSDPGTIETWDRSQAKSPVIRTRSVIGQYATIVGGRTIGPGSYVAAGELVRVDVPPETFLQGGRMRPMAAMHGLVRARRDPPRGD